MSVTEIEGRLKFRLPKVGTTGLEILELSYADIPREWICGSLHRMCRINGHKKPQGCAMGLIGMNGGLGEFRAYHDADEWGQETGHIDVSWLDPTNILESSAAVREAALCLLLAMTDEELNRVKWNISEDDPAIANLTDDFRTEMSKLVAGFASDGDLSNDIDTPSFSDIEDAIVSHNDGDGMNAPKAAAWFCKAVQIAESRTIS